MPADGQAETSSQGRGRLIIHREKTGTTDSLLGLLLLLLLKVAESINGGKETAWVVS